jgi:hypothetical protein
MEFGAGIYSPLTLGVLAIIAGFGVLILNGNIPGSLFFLVFGVLMIAFHVVTGFLMD